MDWVLYVLALHLFWIKSTLSNYTFTYDMASRCKEHICRHGYKYETYYLADSKLRQVKYSPEMQFELHFAILAASNGHILLSSVPKPESGDPVYEIVVGGGGNKFSELRRNLRRNSKSTAQTLGILSPIEYRAFYIKIGEDGLVEFGKEGDKLPLLSYFDNDPVTVKYFSFTAWNGVEAKFLYDCPVAGENGSGSNTTDSKAIEPKLSNRERLRKDLLQDRIVNIPPGPVISVKFGVKLLTVRYDAFEAKLYSDFVVVVSWTDDSMAWNPTKYNNTTVIKFRQGQIWMPSFLVTNSVNMEMLESNGNDQISMVNSGEATFHFRSSLTTWCVDHTDSLSKWPRDEYSCPIVIEPWNTHEIIQLVYLEPNTSKIMFTEKDAVLKNMWEVQGKQGVVTLSMWNKALDMDSENDNETSTDSDKFIVHLKLRRRATSYNIVFYTPLLVLMTFLLMSFWTEPLRESRIWFYAGSATFICFGLSSIDYLVPTHNLPSILVFYTTVLFGILLALIINIFMISSNVKIYKNRLIQYLLTLRAFRTLFCLAALKFTEKDAVLKNMWEVQGKQGVVTLSMWNKALDMDSENDNETSTDSDKFIVHLKLRRRATSYNIVFYTPLLVLMTFLLMSFWTEPLRESRIWFYAGSATFICFGLSSIDYLVPTHNLPSILVFYTTVLFGILLALIINIFMISSNVKIYKNRLIQYLLTLRAFRTLFCLAALKTCNTYESINQGFVAQEEDDDSGVVAGSRSSNIEEMEKETSCVGEKEECAEVVDKVLFTVYSLVFAVLLANHF